MKRYDIQKCIGEGSFGRAFLCKDLDTDELVVVKQIHLGSQSPDLQEASLREASLLKMLDHPNIISFKDSFIDNDFLYIVMEYASGGDLNSKINERKGQHFSEQQILTWFSQLCLALQVIHQHKILHRDIKSQNVFIDSKGNCKLGDFGIAKCLDTTGQFAQTVVGSPFYLSPEICQGIPYNSKTDIWSLGCVLYEMCTLTQAFSSNCIGGIVMKILRAEQPPIPGFYSEDLQNMVDLMLQKNAGRRPSVSQILGSAFLKPFLPVSHVTQVAVPKVSEDKIKAKRPKTVLVNKQKNELSSKQPNKGENINMCLMIKHFSKKEEETKMKRRGAPMHSQVKKPKKPLIEPVFEPIKNSLPNNAKNNIKKKKDANKPDKNKIKECVEPVFKPADGSSKPAKERDDLEKCVQIDQPPHTQENRVEQHEGVNDFEYPSAFTTSRQASIEEIEGMRKYLEDLIGTTRLIDGYNAIRDGANSEAILSVLGKENIQAAFLIQRLIISEEALDW